MVSAPFFRNQALFLVVVCIPALFRSGGKEQKMKDYSYNDPYEGVQFFAAIEDGDDEGWNKALEWLEQNRKEIQSEDRRQRYNAPYRIEALDFEGTDYASEENVEEDYLLSDEEERTDQLLRMNLTPTQYRRFRLYMDGMSLRDIARFENADYSSVRECIEAARKKLAKIYGNTPSKTPPKSPYSEG